MKTLKERNAKFKAATPAEKRVMISTDVLDQLTAKKIKAAHAGWALLTFSAPQNPKHEVCNIIDNAQCTCCALGAMMLSEVRINDKLKIGALMDDGGSGVDFRMYHGGDEDRLCDFFDYQQLSLIESAYERGTGRYDGTERSVSFGERYKTPERRLRAIMENIVANNGTFKP